MISELFDKIIQSAENILKDSKESEGNSPFVAGFRARIFPLPGREPASKENGLGYGQKWPVLLAKYDRGLYSWKTLQCSLEGGLEEFSETWPKCGIMQDGSCWELTIPADLMNEKESGLCPTPTNSMITHQDMKQAKYAGNGDRPKYSDIKFPTPCKEDYRRRGPNSRQQGLPELVHKWATPSARDYKDTPGMSFKSINPDGFDENRLDQIARQVYNKTYPTPTGGSKEKGGQGIGLQGGSGARNKLRRDGNEELLYGQLNPDWTEWLMNWPIFWSDLKPMNKIHFNKWLTGCYDWNVESEITLFGYRIGNVDNWSVDPADIGICPRVTDVKNHRVDRIKAIGNGQVPITAATAFLIMMEDL